MSGDPNKRTSQAPRPLLIEREQEGGVRIQFDGAELAAFADQNPGASFDVEYEDQSYTISVPYYLEHRLDNQQT